MDTSRSRGGADAEDTDELLLYADLNVSRSDFDPEPLRPDHCDLLLDAIDAQLGQLQVQTHKHQDVFMKPICRDAAPLQWSQSPSKDTGLGSTMQTNDTPMSCLDLIRTPLMEKRSDRRRGPESQQEAEDMSDIRTRIKEDAESRRDEVMWRLQRLLGDTCKDNALTESWPPSDSICTEDFVQRFRDEMVEVPRANVRRLDKEDTEGTEILDGDSVCAADRASTLKSVLCSLSKKTSQRRQEELDECPPHHFRVNVSTIKEETPNGRDGRTGWRSLIQSLTGLDDSSSHTQEESEPQSTSVHSSSLGDEHQRSPSVRKALHKKRQTPRLARSLGDEGKDADDETDGCSGRCGFEGTPETMQCTKMKERLKNLRRKCEREEETLKMKRTQLRDVELCLSELRQRRKHAVQELERLSAETAQVETEKQRMESVLSDRRGECDSVSCHVEELQVQRESFLSEIRGMEEELASQRKKTGVMVMSVLEREELERQLDDTRTALFAERRRARERLESMQESLEQTREELQRATESESSLRSSCARLQEKQAQKKEKIQALEAERGQRQLRVVTLEKMLAQKELQLLDCQEQRGALQAERDELKGALRHLKTQHCTAQREAREHGYQMMLKEDEVKQLQTSVEQQREQAKSREDELHKDASEKVHRALEEERRRREAEQVEAVQVLCGRLEEENRRSVERVKSELQQEKSRTVALKHKVTELKKRMQESERDGCAQQREHESLLTVICKSLKEEHQAELHRLQKQTAQVQEEAQKERRGTEVRFEQAAHLAEKEAERLRVVLEDRESSYQRITAELEQQHRLWAQELRAECQHLHLLLEQSGAKPSPVPLPVSPTEAEALTSLRALREQVEHVVTHLHQELHSQRLHAEQLRKHKERELSAQREQLRLENDQARDCLKERLIQEHIEELSSLTRSQATDDGRVAASLRKQLKAKDLELRRLQRSMSEWKEQTTARLARTFEEELTAELERCKTKLLRGRKTKIQGRERKSEKDEGGKEMVPNAKNSPFHPSLHVVAVDSAAPYSPSDVASFKLLRFLQTRVKQLRLENQTYRWNPSPPRRGVAVDLSGSYLSTIAQGQDSEDQDLLK